MGRDSWRYAQHERERLIKRRVNPIWRGVGCLVVTVFTAGAYLFADWFLRANADAGWVAIPSEVLRPSFAPWLPTGIAIKVVVAILFLILSYGLFSTIYAIAFPHRPGETDSPPLKRSGAGKRR